jgi:hypothetical protein
MTDVPTLTSATASNFAVLNPLNSYASLGVTNSNLTYGGYGGTYATAPSTIAVSSGKFYWETTVTAIASAGTLIGIADAKTSWTSAANYVGQDAASYSYYFGGNKYNNATGSAYGASYTTGDVIGIALDLTAGTLTFYKNNVSQGTAFSGLSGSFVPAFSIYGQAGTLNISRFFTLK